MAFLHLMGKIPEYKKNLWGLRVLYVCYSYLFRIVKYKIWCILIYLKRVYVNTYIYLFIHLLKAPTHIRKILHF